MRLVWVLIDGLRSEDSLDIILRALHTHPIMIATICTTLHCTTLFEQRSVSKLSIAVKVYSGHCLLSCVFKLQFQYSTVQIM